MRHDFEIASYFIRVRTHSNPGWLDLIGDSASGLDKRPVDQISGCNPVTHVNGINLLSVVYV